VVGQPLVVEIAGFGVDLVLLDLVELADEVCGVAVTEVAAVGQIQREDLITRLKGGKVDRLVGLGARVWLDVDVVGSPELLCAVDRELFDLVGVLTAGVVAFAGIPLAYLLVSALPCASRTALLT